MSQSATTWVKQFLRIGLAAAIVFCLLFSHSASAQANERLTRNQTLTVGPYTVVIHFSDNPPHVETPLEVTLILSEKGDFSGQLIAQPGQGIDAVPVHANLAPDQKVPHALRGAIYLPVRGVWHLVIDLNGPRGQGTASMDLTVSVPDAIPTWLGWLIGLSPLLGCAWLAYQQGQYRRRLLIEKRSANRLES